MIDFERLATWMHERELPGSGEPLQHRFLSGGTQNKIFRVARREASCVGGGRAARDHRLRPVTEPV